MGIRVKRGGLLTTVQDLGIMKYQNFGVSPAGPMDRTSFIYGNILVGNGNDAAGLEMTMTGPSMEFTSDCVIALTGADMQPELNGRPVRSNMAISVLKGDVLELGQARTGCRGYLAFSGGGLDVPRVLGSRSTLVRAKFGGFHGRALKTGDEIGFVSSVAKLPDMTLRILPLQEQPEEITTVRVIPGPQDDRFTEKGLETFFSSVYQVGDQCDRMGFRLEGEKIEHKTDANIISDGIAEGSVQVPGSGMPIIMLAERQSTGGYTKIANVITEDLPKLAQMKPGDRLRFEKTDIKTAQDLYIARLDSYEDLRRKIAAGLPNPEKKYTVTVNGNVYRVCITRTGGT